MKHLLTTSISIVLLFVAAAIVGCEQNSVIDVNTVYYSDIVTCKLQPDSTVHFQQILRNDQGSMMLYPQPPVKAQVYDGQRALLQYYVKSTNPDSNHNITALSLVPVRHDTIISAIPDTIAAYPNDPLKLTAGWRTGDFLNMQFSIEYNSIPHRLDIFYHPEQTSSDTINVILRHDNNGDIMGYWTTAYASFYIPQLNTYKVMRMYANMANDPMDYIIFNLK